MHKFPIKFPLQDTITSVEEIAGQLPKDDADNLQGGVCGTLRSVWLPKDNMKKEHRKALKELRSLEDEVILPADKGNATVMMKKSDYDERMRGMLEDTTTYKKLKKDPTATQEARIVRTLLQLHNNGEITKSIYNRIRPSGSCPPRIYGLPKIHKPHTPLRPIVSCINAPSYKLSKYIASVISPLAGKTSSHVLNSKHFAGLVKEERVEVEETLVSFDVTSLFTNVPIDEAVDVIHRKLAEEEEGEDLVERTPLPAERIAELLQLCLKSTYFSYNGEFYEQRQGAAMGSPVSAVVANLYMEFFEELALKSAPSRPRFWKRYVDDTCCIVKRDAVEPLLCHLNDVRPTIKFTMELEKDGSLPFLDTKLTRRDNGTLSVAVFRKQTHTDRYLHFNSHHPVSAKRSAVRSLFDRARNITLQKKDLQREEEHLTATFKQNGYPLPFIRAVSSSIQEPPTPPMEEPDEESQEEEERKQPLAVIPYVSGVSEWIRKACEKFNLKVVFKSGPTLRSLLTKVKDPLPKEKLAGVVYQIPCQCGKVYVGETQRRLATRVKEHRDACTKGDTWKSAIAEHQWEEQHQVDWDSTRVLDRATRPIQLRVKEALHIQRTPANNRLNCDEGYELPGCWIATMKKLGGGASRASTNRVDAPASAPSRTSAQAQ